MSLKEWQKNGWVKPHDATPQEIERLFDVIERDLKVSGNKDMDPDWRFVAPYNAALQGAAVALYASGFESTKGGGAHYYTIESLKLTVGDEGTVDELQSFKAKRGGAVYESTGIASETEISELRNLAEKLRNRVQAWLLAEHPALAPKPSRRKGKGK
ncbi:MAG TPA: hypothetical protein VFE47_26210 [Tepidisphaeraceae bacterium]|jgi:hypothetical protein|nr:hypothetical protein [Tepidisphaeraceae bacterium]